MTDTQAALEALKELKSYALRWGVTRTDNLHIKSLSETVRAALTAPAELVAYTSEAMLKLLASNNADYGASYLMSKHRHLSMSIPLYRSPSSEAARIAELEKQAAVDKAELAHLGRILKRIRFTLESVAENIEDEGARVYFGSTNDADQLKDVADDAFNWNMGRIMKSADLPDLYGDLRTLRERNAELGMTLTEYNDALRSAFQCAQRDAITDVDGTSNYRLLADRLSDVLARHHATYLSICATPKGGDA